MKKLGLVLLAMALLLGSVAWAEGVVVKEAGNKYCPVGLEQVSGKDFVEYNGIKYGLCCPMCAKKFLADPEKYLNQLKEKETGNSASEASAEHVM